MVRRARDPAGLVERTLDVPELAIPPLPPVRRRSRYGHHEQPPAAAAPPVEPPRKRAAPGDRRFTAHVQTVLAPEDADELGRMAMAGGITTGVLVRTLLSAVAAANRRGLDPIELLRRVDQ